MSAAAQHATAPSAAPGQTPFLRLCADYKAYAAMSEGLAREASRWVGASDVPDVVSRTFVAAVKREATDARWNPDEETVHQYLARILGGVRINFRRSLRRKPAMPTLEGEDFEGPSLHGEDALLLAEAEREHARVLAELHKTLVEESQAGISPKVFAAMTEGIRGHDRIAAHIGCAREQIGHATRRIAYRCKLLRERFQREAAAS